MQPPSSSSSSISSKIIYTQEFDTLVKRLERLEKENRTLTERLNQLKQQKTSTVAALLANVVLLVVTGLMIGYLGLFPASVDRLPLQARTVEAEEFILHAKGGPALLRVKVADKGIQVQDEAGKVLYSKP